jgi:hypothetical protein
MALVSPRGRVVGDLRNKFRKLEDQERIRAMQKRMEAAKPKPMSVRCQCGNDQRDAPLWSWTGDRKVKAPAGIYCPACLPYELLYDVIWDVANLRAGEIKNDGTSN